MSRTAPCPHYNTRGPHKRIESGDLVCKACGRSHEPTFWQMFGEAFVDETKDKLRLIRRVLGADELFEDYDDADDD